jgi:phospholipid-binding lipoprotein MlaA
MGGLLAIWLLAAPVFAAEPGVPMPAMQTDSSPVLIQPVAGKKNPDPWEGFNRAIYRFNDVADRYLLKPVAKGYKAVTPEVVRTGVTNFFTNLRSPIVILNDVLQGKIKQAGGDTVRFVVNSTVGVAGLVDVAVRINLPLHDEDFGQTLGVWGVPSGPYLVLPFFGPSSVRDGVGFGVDAAANPRRYLINNEADLILLGVDVVNSRASLLDLESIIQGDRYLFIRDLYLQRREFAVKDGQVDDPFLDDDDPGASDQTNPGDPAAPADPQAPQDNGPTNSAEPASTPDQSRVDVEAVPGSAGLAVMVTLGSAPSATLAASGF